MATPSQLAMALAPTAPQQHATIGPTDVLGAYSLATNTAEQQYQAKLQQQNALWGGLAGLGGAGLTAYILKGGLFGNKTPPAAPPAPTAAGNAAAADSSATGNAAAANATGPTQFASGAGGETAPITPVASSPLTSVGMPADTAAAPASSLFADAGTPMLSGADMAAAMPANSVVGGDFGALGLAPNSVVASDFAGLPAAGGAMPSWLASGLYGAPAAGTLDAGTALGSGSVAAADAAATAPVVADAGAGAATLADLLPLLFAA